MGKKEGREIDRLSKQFMLSQAIASPLYDCLTKLRSSSLSEDDLKFLYQWFQTADQFFPLKISSTCFPQTRWRRFRGFTGTKLIMGISGTLEAPRPNFQGINSLLCSAFENELIFNEREYPLNFKSEHVEKRYEGRVKKPLQYDTKNFILSVCMTLAIIRPFQEKYKTQIEQGKTLPIIIPHYDGFFVGYALPVDKDFLNPKGLYWAKRGKRRSEDMFYFDHTICVQPEWSPLVDCTMSSFVDIEKFHPDQKEVYRQFSQVYKNPDSLAAFDALALSYAHGRITGLKVDNKNAGDLFNKLDEIIGSILETSAWNEAFERSQDSLKQNPPSTEKPKGPSRQEMENFVQSRILIID